MALPVADVYNAPAGQTLYAGRFPAAAVVSASLQEQATLVDALAGSVLGSSTLPFKVERTGNRYATLAQAVAGAVSGDTIKVAPGTYVVSATGDGVDPGSTYIQFGIQLATLTIEWEVPGQMPVIDLSAPVFRTGSIGGSGRGIIAAGSNRSLTVRGLHLIGSRIADSWGIASDAGYQQSPANPVSTLTIEYCKLVNWSDGVKTTYSNQNLSLNLRYSTIENCSEGSLTHGIYVQGDFLDVFGCTFRTTVAGNLTNAANLGHLLKSRMKRTRVRASLFDMKGGGAACVETPSGGDLEVYGNIILQANVGDPSNPPIKYGFEESANFINVTLTGAAIQVGDVITGATSGSTGVVVALQSGGTKLVYRSTSPGTYFNAAGQNITIGGVVRAVQVGAYGGSIDGSSNDGRTHRVRVGQNTIWKQQGPSYPGNPFYAVACLWIDTDITDDLGNLITDASILAAGFVRDNLVADLPAGLRTVNDYSAGIFFPDNTAIADSTLTLTGSVTSLGIYSGTAVAGAANVAAYAYAGEFTVPVARTDSYRGGQIAGLPTWRQGRTALRLFSVAPTSTLAQQDPALDASVNQNGAGNTPNWSGASYPQAQMLNAWGGGAYNRVTKALDVTGGGHAGYSGNEIYRLLLSSNAPTWTRRCPPSGSTPRPATFSGGFPVNGATNELCTDGRPKQVHPYGGLVQDNAGRLFRMPGGAANDLSVGNVWTQRAYRFVGSDWDATGAAFSPGYGQPCSACLDPDLGVIWAAWGQRVWSINTETLAATAIACNIVGSPGFGDGTPYYGTGNYAAAQQMALFAEGQGSGFELLVVPTSAPATGRYVTSTGTPPPSGGGKHYGIAWDSTRNRLIYYNGGTRFFTRTPPASGSWVTGVWTWAELSVDSSGFAPGTDTGNGLFGRVFYDADYDCVGVQPSSVTEPLTFLPLS